MFVLFSSCCRERTRHDGFVASREAPPWISQLGIIFNMPLSTRVTKMLGIQHPIIMGGMTGVGTPELAAAVSNAGKKVHE